MKIQIIGLGIVGTAQAYLSQKLGHEVIGYDIALSEHPHCKVTEIQEADITFICTPEGVVEDVVRKLQNKKSLVVIKSTVPIGATKILAEKYDMHLCHNPEFLREKYLLEDVMNPSRVVIGKCCEEHGNILQRFYEPLEKEIFVTDPTTSETVKLVSNSYLATLITFWNEINELATSLRLSTKDIANIVKHDSRISEYGTTFFGEPYDGKCLPKDMKQIIQVFRDKQLNPKLFEACEEINKRERKNEKVFGIESLNIL